VAEGAADLLAEAPVLLRERSGEIDLVAAAPRILLPAETGCLRLPAGRWEVVLLDTTYVMPGPERPLYRKSGSFGARLLDHSLGTAGGAAPAPSAMASPTQHHEHDAPAAIVNTWRGSTAPWQVGDVLDYASTRVPSGGVVVERILHGHFAIAQRAAGERVSQATMDSLVAGIDDFQAHHRAWLRGMFGSDAGAPNGQLLVVVLKSPSDWASGGEAGRAHSELVYGDRAWEIGDRGTAYRALAHEFAHSYHMTYMAQYGPMLGDSPSQEQFQIEGIADHVAYRAAAERHGVQFGQNAPMLNFMQTVWGALFMTSNDLEQGYHPAAALLLHLTDRLAAGTSLSWREAHDSVTVAVKHNRWGCTWKHAPDPTCGEFDGLFDLLRRHHGAGWNAVAAVLTYVMAQAVDDLTDNPVLQNPHVRRDGAGGRGPTGGTVRAYAGGGGSIQIPVGGFARFSIEAEEPGAFRLEADHERVRWMIVRLH
jgi:hypothetical protein